MERPTKFLTGLASFLLLAVAFTGCVQNSVPSVELSTASMQDAYQARSSGSYAGNISDTPSNGNWYLVIFATIASNLDSTIFLDPNYFQIDATNGQSYSYSTKADYSMPSFLSPKSSSKVSIVYEIPLGSVPNALHFDDARYTASVPLTWSGAIPQSGSQLTMDVLSVEEASVAKTNGHYTGDLPAFPDPNLRYIIIRLNVTSNMDSTLLMSPSYFTLVTSDGLSWDTSLVLTSTVPSSLSTGFSSIVTLGYEINQGSGPTKLTFDNFTEKMVVIL